MDYFYIGAIVFVYKLCIEEELCRAILTIRGWESPGNEEFGIDSLPEETKKTKMFKSAKMFGYVVAAIVIPVCWPVFAVFSLGNLVAVLVGPLKS